MTRGKICNFLQIALRVQHWRLSIFGFLTVCQRINFYKATISFKRCSVIVNESGWEALQKLLSLDNYSLGYKDFEMEGWKTSVVFSAPLAPSSSNCVQGECGRESWKGAAESRSTGFEQAG